MEMKKYGLWHLVSIVFSGLGILLSINQIFKLRLLGFMPLDTSYLYLIIALFLSLVFVLYPASKKSPGKKVPWYDVILFVLTVVIGVYFCVHGLSIIELGWEYIAPAVPTAFSVMLWFLALEAVRRTSGLPLAGICFVFSLYPLYAGILPGFLQGQSFDFLTTARIHAMSVNSILGIPLNTVATLLIGFMLFGVVLQETGGGTFFFNVAQSIFGHTRGGTAKVAVVGSSLFGMLSGSAVSNVLTIGSMTIPAMKRAGFPAHYSAAIEACASTGGSIAPPVMGAAAFIMASFLNVPYASVAIAAAIPAFLFYWGLYVQVDGYAAKAGLKGMPREELPGLWDTLKNGWYYILVVIVLCYFLLTLRVEAWAPYYASVVLIVLAMIKKETRLGLHGFLSIINKTGKVLVELTAILAAIGLLIGSLSVTGVAFSFSREIVDIVGNHTLPILCIGAITSFILGMGMTATACYVFLAIVMAPALVSLGMDPMAAHLFVLYWAAVSYITPPVALAAIVAAGVAGANPMQTAWSAVKFGAVKYIVPFFFVYNPALITHGTWTEIIFVTFINIAGVFIIGCALEGYFIGIGRIGYPVLRILLFISGMLIAFPNKLTTFIGMAMIIVLAVIVNILRKSEKWSELMESTSEVAK